MRTTRRFAAEPRSVSAARRFATSTLAGAPPEVVQGVELMVSELATNCVRHAHSAFQLTITSARGEIRVEVSDHGRGTPAMRPPGPSDPTGRGLQIIAMLSKTWGVEPVGAPGKMVWFTVSTAATARGATPGKASRFAPAELSPGHGELADGPHDPDPFPAPPATAVRRAGPRSALCGLELRLLGARSRTHGHHRRRCQHHP